jgi:serine protease inhibitor
MAWAGARGRTAEAMSKTLGLGSMLQTEVLAKSLSLKRGLEGADSLVRLDIANSLWARQGLTVRTEYRNDIERNFDGRMSVLDFASPQAPKTINAWVSEKTKGKIEKIIERIPSDMVLYLINAVYFKGRWQTLFNKAKTAEDDFHLPDESTKQLPFMHQDGEYQYLKGNGFQAVRLPYGSGRYAMYVFLPDKRDGLQAFLKTLDANSWAAWLPNFAKAKGHVALPRFKADYLQDLVKVLDKLGMGPAFGDGADFSGMAKAPLAISEVLHKAVVEVNEEGTEAAAVTSVGMRITSVRPEPEPFKMIIDHPFFMAIADQETGTILFMGAIYEPK